jgi:hypothetical protein
MSVALRRPFSSALPKHALFGVTGGLEFFRLVMDVEAMEFELTPSSSLPATTDPTP